MGRVRTRKNQSLPPNLYFDKSQLIFRYRRPDTGKSTLFGKDRSKAIAAAKKLNSLLMPGEDLVARVLTEGKTLTQYIDERFMPVHLPERRIAEETMKGYKNQINNIKVGLGDQPLYGISIKMVSDFLGKISGARQSNKYRNLLAMILNYAKGEGYIDSNPAEDTLVRNHQKKRKRLKYEEFQEIHKLAGKQEMIWMQNAMDLGLITLQRREEIVHAKFSDILTETIDGKTIELLPVIQKKTKKHGDSAYIKIILNGDLKRLIDKCRNSNVLSPFIIHHSHSVRRKSKSREHHTQILPDFLTREFSRLRDETGLFNHLEKDERPTFHEVRSLAIKLHEDRGYDAQALAGHTNRQMTDAYKKGHEINWTYAEAAALGAS